MQGLEACNIIQTCIEHVHKENRILIKIFTAKLCPLNDIMIHNLTISHFSTVCSHLFTESDITFTLAMSITIA